MQLFVNFQPLVLEGQEETDNHIFESFPLFVCFVLVFFWLLLLFFSASFHVILATNPQCKNYYSHVKGKETEVQRG